MKKLLPMKSFLPMLAISAAAWLAAISTPATPIPVVSGWHADVDGFTLKMNPGILRVQEFGPDIVRVTYGPAINCRPPKVFPLLPRPPLRHLKPLSPPVT